MPREVWPLLDLGPPHPAPELSASATSLQRRATVAELVHGNHDPAERYERLQAYGEHWGHRELLTALQYAHRQAPLPGLLGDLLRQLLRARWSAWRERWSS